MIILCVLLSFHRCDVYLVTFWEDLLFMFCFISGALEQLCVYCKVYNCITVCASLVSWSPMVLDALHNQGLGVHHQPLPPLKPKLPLIPVVPHTRCFFSTCEIQSTHLLSLCKLYLLWIMCIKWKIQSAICCLVVCENGIHWGYVVVLCGVQKDVCIRRCLWMTFMKRLAQYSRY